MSCLRVQPTGFTLHRTKTVRLGCGCILNNSALSRTSFILWQYSVGYPQNRTGAVGPNYRSKLVWRQSHAASCTQRSSTQRRDYFISHHTVVWSWGGHTLSFDLFLSLPLPHRFFVVSCALFPSLRTKLKKTKTEKTPGTRQTCISVVHLWQCNDAIGLPRER